jgi:hypothetical protein
MKNEKNNSESGKSFQQHQAAVDKAFNEKAKGESEAEENEQQANGKRYETRTTDVSEKKTGGGKQKSPGD